MQQDLICTWILNSVSKETVTLALYLKSWKKNLKILMMQQVKTKCNYLPNKGLMKRNKRSTSTKGDYKSSDYYLDFNNFIQTHL